MYKKYISYMVLFQMIVLVNISNTEIMEEILFRHSGATGLYSGLFQQEYVSSREESVKSDMGFVGYRSSCLLENLTGSERCIPCFEISRNYRINVTEEEIMILARIVEAEAGGEDLTGKEMVANVVINRVLAEEFPNNVRDVVFQAENGVYQFSPVGDGRYDSVVISEESMRATYLALSGEDNSQGALYFVSRGAADPERLRWFDESLTLLSSHGGHEFFR